MIEVTRVYRNGEPHRGPITNGEWYVVVVETYPDNRWMPEAKRVHTEYHRRQKHGKRR